MKPRVEEFNIASKKLDGNKKIITLADLHFNVHLNKKIIFCIQEFLDSNRNEISFVAMPGDIMYDFNYSNSLYIRELKYLLKSFCEIKTPVVLSLGNHDIQCNEEKVKEIFKSLNTIENVYPLDNEVIRIDDIKVGGFSPSHDVYKPSWHGKKSNEAFVQQFLESQISFDEKELNILLNHIPHPIASDYSQIKLKKILEKVDLIISGHLHNGYIPNAIEKKFKNIIKDYGLWECFSIFPPKIFGKIDLCRGMHDLCQGNTKLVVSKGVRPYTGYIAPSIPIIPNITVINFLNEKETSKKLLLKK